MYDELALDTLGDKKTALFLIMSDTDSTFNFLISMVYTQLFNLLCDKADDVYGGKLPIHVRCLIDECANIGQIPNLEKLVATIRSREISACLVLQARSQLKAIYKDNADTIVGNMDSQIFLGGSEPTTLKDLSEMLGKETIDAFNTSDTRGNSPSYGTTFQKMGHELLSRDELAVLDGGKCILQLRGVRPFLSDKYDLTQHPNYKLTSDYDPKNTFDIEKYLNRKEKIHPGDEFIVVDADIIICDPECEYAPLVERLHGQVIHISPASTQYINPMDINSNYSEEDNPLALKADFVLSLCELVVGGKEGLQPVEKTVIDRCVHVIYRKYFENPTPENMPLLEDLYNALLTQDEPEARHVAAALEIYVKGSLNIFNHHTNVDINNRIVCFDIKQLGKQLKKLGMLIVQDAVWGRVTANRSAGKSTRYYADEFHLLLKEEQTAAYSVEIWKRFRKWGGIPTALTQNVKDLLASPEVSNIFENSDFVYMLNQANGDRQILAKQLNISPHQLSYVTHSGEGEGLLFFGNVILPFVDHFPKDLELYRILTTRLSEVAEAQKHE